MKRKLTDKEIEAILLMVKESAAELEVHDADFFEEYEETLRETKTVSPSDARSGEYSSPFAYTDILLGVGLVFLGQTAAALYEYVVHKGVEASLKKISARLSPQEKTSEILEDASKYIVLTLQLPKEIDEAQLKQILTPQLVALMKLPEAASKIPNDDASK
jgi:hypothetical protein